MKTYLVSYRYNGAEWNIELKAESQSDAEARLKQMMFARVDGELFARIPSAFGPLAALTVFLQNLYRRMFA